MSKIGQFRSEITFVLVFSIIISTLCPFQYGLHLAELNAPHDMIICETKPVTDKLVSSKNFQFLDCIQMTEAEFAFLTSVYILGGLIGAILAGPASGRYGRLLSMRLSCLFFTIGSIVETVSDSVPTMSTGRFINGLGAGTATVVTPLYIHEIAPPKMRGLLGTMTQIMICLGILTTQTLGYIFSSDAQWRIIIGFGAGLGIFSLVALFFIPESPTWLAANNNLQLAKKIMQRIRGADHPTRGEIAKWNNHSDTSTEEDPLLTSTDQDHVGQSGPYNSRDLITNNTEPQQKGFFSLIRDPSYRPATFILIGIMFAQQFSGVNSVNLYSVSLFRGALPVSSMFLTILISCINIVVTILCAPLSDIIGNKKCLLISIISMGIMSFCLAISLMLTKQLLSAIFVVLFVISFAVGLGPVPFRMASELVGEEAVSAAQSWSLAGNYISTYIVAQFFPIVNFWMNAKWGGMGWVYFLFTAFLGMSAIFVALLVPQSKGKVKTGEVDGQATGEDITVQNSSGIHQSV
ncbi:putative metabolite transport protein [Golovinomyces cichoracearum]|uniref:Putative metabolite transport protein n=1 Tax=Golovinomyces cichoracearum TaxID=62708 RepID=A0A420H6I8_9PEZI|nr:putative metabolite transport protein [Golovinomyces cichoracearum]